MSNKTSIRKLLLDAADRGSSYREDIVGRRVAPSKEAIAALDRLVGEMPEHGSEDAEVLALLDEVGSPATVAMASPRYFGFVIGGALPVTVATNWLSTAWDQNVGMHEVTPATSYA